MCGYKCHIYGGGKHSIESKDFTKEILNYKIKNYDALSESETKEAYVFHIFTESLKEDSINIESKLNALAKQLSKVYPCEIRLHYVDDSHFNACEKWGSSYAAYYRMCADELLDSSIKVGLYLDCDMLVLGDLRGLFSIDLEHYFAYVVRDYAFHTSMKIPHKSDINAFLDYDKNYFNSGLMLLNLDACRQAKMWENSKNIFNNYAIKFPDQDTLNYIFKGNVGILSPCFNMMAFSIGNYPIAVSSDEEGICDMYYTRKQLECAKSSVMIYHYTPYKPWESASLTEYPSAFNYKKVLEITKMWRNMARKTPIFKDELNTQLTKIEQDEILNYAIFALDKFEKKGSEKQIIKIKKRVKYIIISQIAFIIAILILIFMK